MTSKQPRRILGTTIVRFIEPGQTFTGVLTEKGMMAGQSHEYGIYDFTCDGNRCRVNGTTQLDDALKEAQLGDTLGITFVGKTRTMEGYEVHQFEVELIYRPEVDEGDDHD